MAIIFKEIDNQNLYEQLISRLYHIEQAFLIRRHIKLHYSKFIGEDTAKAYLIVRNKYRDFFSIYEESLLWFITVELWSRFLYPKTKRGLFTLVEVIKDDGIKEKHLQFQKRHKDVTCYIKTQRNKYFAHADEVVWAKCPNVWDKEYDTLINDLKELMEAIGGASGSQRLPTNSTRAVEHTCELFDDLLKINCTDLDVSTLSIEYNEGVENFINS